MTDHAGGYEAELVARYKLARARLAGKPIEVPAPRRLESIAPEAEPASRATATNVVRLSPPHRQTTKTHEGGWTHERVGWLKQLWHDGVSASRIAEAMGKGLTRNAVLGKARRLDLPPRTVEIRKPYVYVYRPKKPKASKPPTRSNIVRAPAVFKEPEPKPKKVVALPVRGIPDSQLVEIWLAQNGGARKVEQGGSGDPWALRSFLDKRGFVMTNTAQRPGFFQLSVRGARGRPQTLKQRDLIAFVDRIRRAEGLEPILS